MNKYYGIVGYAIPTEIRPGVWDDVIVERKYYGDVIRNTKRWDTTTEGVNDNLNISNSISIVADPYAYNHFFGIKYLEWCGALWKVTEVEVQMPRLNLSIGGVYNGPRPTSETPCRTL